MRLMWLAERPHDLKLTVPRGGLLSCASGRLSPNRGTHDSSPHPPIAGHTNRPRGGSLESSPEHTGRQHQKSTDTGELKLTPPASPATSPCRSSRPASSAAPPSAWPARPAP